MDALIEYKPPDIDYRNLSDKLMRQWLFDRSYHTKRMYTMVIERVCKFNHRSAVRLDLATIQAWITELQATGASPKTIGYYQRILKSWFRFIVSQQAAPFNPLDGVRVKTMGAPVDTERALSVSETRRLIESAPNKHARFALELLYQAALRRDELARLTWGMVSFEGGAAVLDVLGKGNKRRKVRLTGPLVEFMQANRQPDDCRVVPRVGETFRRYIKAAALKAGLPAEVTPHWLRHSRCSHLLMAGVSDVEVRDFMGHGNLTTTNIYTHALRKIAMPDTLEDE
jgi:integrase/recombinase XerD